VQLWSRGSGQKKKIGNKKTLCLKCFRISFHLLILCCLMVRVRHYGFFFLQWRKLIRLVKQFGVRKWAQIAERVAGRAGKQCRERWHNHLRPDIKVSSPITSSRVF
jgi:hypothetical protein